VERVGQFIAPSTTCVRIDPYNYYPPACITTGGPYHGDGRRFSLQTGGGVTSRINAVLEVNLDNATRGYNKVWCDESTGPWMLVGPSTTGVGVPTSDLTVSKEGSSITAIIDYAASNPLTVAPDIDARGEFALVAGTDTLEITATVTGDQFPACEAFIEDLAGIRIFLGGFAPDNKEQITRLILGRMNKPKEVWFESEVVVSVDPKGNFKQLKGGGSGSNSTGPACEGLTLTVEQWNGRIMSSIPMPYDAG
jgi:hypothetical protein